MISCSASPSTPFPKSLNISVLWSIKSDKEMKNPTLLKLHGFHLNLEFEASFFEQAQNHIYKLPGKSRNKENKNSCWCTFCFCFYLNLGTKAGSTKLNWIIFKWKYYWKIYLKDYFTVDPSLHSPYMNKVNFLEEQEKFIYSISPFSSPGLAGSSD